MGNEFYNGLMIPKESVLIICTIKSPRKYLNYKFDMQCVPWSSKVSILRKLFHYSLPV